MIDAAGKWYAVHTHPQSEPLAMRNLIRQGFDVYLPQYWKQWKHARRIEKRATALFPRYLFVRMDTSNVRWRAVNSTNGVASLVCNGDAPAPINDEIIQEIRAREDEKGMIHVDQIRFKKGDPVQVNSGALLNAVGIFEALSDKDRVMLLLDLLGRKIRVVLPVDAVTAPA